MSKKLIKTLIEISVGLYVLSIALGAIDTYFIFRWYTFWLHIISLLVLCFLYFKTFDFRVEIRKVKAAEIQPIIVIIIIAEIVNFFLLSQYPFVSLSDELRDGGLYAVRIMDGTIRNIFGYGAYDAHGLIIPVISGFFYHIFHASVLTYRFPAALLSTIDVILIYFLVRVTLDKKVAFWSALILATLPLHMFFARTQVVVAFNFFWVPVILIPLYILAKRMRYIDYVFLGAVIGFSLGFHAAIRSFGLLILAATILLTFAKTSKSQVQRALLSIVFLVMFTVVGFGPRLLSTTTQDFFHTSRFTYEENLTTVTLPTLHNIETLKQNYIKSVMAYVYEPASYFYPEWKPIFSPLIAIFFITGVGYALFILKRPFLNFLIAILLILPFFNSTITDLINADHRLSPLFSIASVFAGLGIVFFIDIFRKRKLKIAFSAFILIYLAFQTVNFFIFQIANRPFTMENYVLTQSFNFIKSNPNLYPDNPGFCIFVSPDNLLHTNDHSVLEQEEFFLPNRVISYASSSSIMDNESHIQKGDCARGDLAPINTRSINCLENSFECPVNYRGNINIYY